MAQKSQEYARFEALVDGLLTVPKSVLKEKMAAHRAKVDAMPPHKRRGPKRKKR
jgi:hypothetical protein